MINLTATGKARSAAEVLSASADEVISEWRASCTAEALGGGTSDELTADRAQAVITTSGPGVIAALIALLESEEPVPDDLPVITEAAASISGNDLAMGTVVRQFSLLRKVLHDHARRHLPAGTVAVAEHQLDLALDALIEASVARAAERLEEDAFIDPLTGLLNRRGLERDLAREMAVAQRHGRSLSLLTLDVDRLKQINDMEGHARGDEALRTLAGAIRTALRGGDTAYRVGGDEFVVLIPGMAPEDVAGFVGRVRASAPTAFSWGAATFPSEATAGAPLLDLADQRLLAYRRAAGEDRVPMSADRFTNPSVAPAAPAEFRWGTHPGILAVFVGALLLGAGSLASAATGTLPGRMQQAAHSVLDKIGVSVPSGKAVHGPERSPAEKSVERFLGDAGTPCTYPDGSPFSGTHGQYVAVHPDDPNTPDDERALAASSRCGRPVAAAPSQPSLPPAVPGKQEDPGDRAEAGRREGAGRQQEARPQEARQPRTTGKAATAPASSETAVQPPRQERPAPGPTTTTATVATSPPPPPAEPVAEQPAPRGHRAGPGGAQDAPAPAASKAGPGEETTGPKARTGERGNKPAA